MAGEFVVQIQIPHVGKGWAVDPYSYQLKGTFSQSEIDAALADGVTAGMTNKVKQQITRDMPNQTLFGAPDFDRAKILVYSTLDPDYVNLIYGTET